jgi:stringent starvation protein B
MIDATDSSSTRPYLIRALYEWCTDNGFTPYVAVRVDESVRVPNEYVKDGEIVLNISFDATSSLKLGNEFIEFKARFAGTAREIQVPISHVLAIYARENGQGMAFPVLASKDQGKTAPVLADISTPASTGGASESGSRPVQLTRVDSEKVSSDDESPDPPRTPAGPRPVLKRVK